MRLRITASTSSGTPPTSRMSDRRGTDLQR
nr:MAG TPA: hypothetical protein [Caudoviricetes sp.]